ncbi:hypothetical protein EC973_006981 [Apophysomyces ossiformis]|uniref:Uncharacterized protein n=1 Tax=Apophysomyces ossiformis TaxID=679940 RepID=A0A8H7BQF3_9FUNG|nr:hypothetical protein EC973_006981 [Apophysomyces ossiformis]
MTTAVIVSETSSTHHDITTLPHINPTLATDRKKRRSLLARSSTSRRQSLTRATASSLAKAVRLSGDFRGSSSRTSSPPPPQCEKPPKRRPSKFESIQKHMRALRPAEQHGWSFNLLRSSSPVSVSSSSSSSSSSFSPSSTITDGSCFLQKQIHETSDDSSAEHSIRRRSSADETLPRVRNKSRSTSACQRHRHQSLPGYMRPFKCEACNKHAKRLSIPSPLLLGRDRRRHSLGVEKSLVVEAEDNGENKRCSTPDTGIVDKSTAPSTAPTTPTTSKGSTVSSSRTSIDVDAFTVSEKIQTGIVVEHDDDNDNDNDNDNDEHLNDEVEEEEEEDENEQEEEDNTDNEDQENGEHVEHNGMESSVSMEDMNTHPDTRAWLQLLASCASHYDRLERVSYELATSKQCVDALLQTHQTIETSLDERERRYQHRLDAYQALVRRQSQMLKEIGALMKQQEQEAGLTEPQQPENTSRPLRDRLAAWLPNYVIKLRWDVSRIIGGAVGTGQVVNHSKDSQGHLVIMVAGTSVTRECQLIPEVT